MAKSMSGGIKKDIIRGQEGLTRAVRLCVTDIPLVLFEARGLFSTAAISKPKIDIVFGTNGMGIVFILLRSL